MPGAGGEGRQLISAPTGTDGPPGPAEPAHRSSRPRRPPVNSGRRRRRRRDHRSGVRRPEPDQVTLARRGAAGRRGPGSCSSGTSSPPRSGRRSCRANCRAGSAAPPGSQPGAWSRSGRRWAAYRATAGGCRPRSWWPRGTGGGSVHPAAAVRRRCGRGPHRRRASVGRRCGAAGRVTCGPPVMVHRRTTGQFMAPRWPVAGRPYPVTWGATCTGPRGAGGSGPRSG
jgi:hypothetical protein